MLTIAVMNFKGGVGKTTLSILLANELAQRGHRVLLSDCDPQNSAMAWQSWSKSNLMVERVEKIRPKKTERSDVDMNVLDCPPRYGDQCIAAAIASDVALVPVMPGPLDYAATGLLVETLREANKRRTSPLPALLVANRTMPRSVVSRLLVETLNKLATQVDGARVSKTALPQRTAYVEALMGTWTPLAKEARTPVRALCDEALALAGRK
ncbi:MAG: ParA family protein [Polyangiaceae bacterium]|nr:ParA family protein [Polyangiaceae bacterium]